MNSSEEVGLRDGLHYMILQLAYSFLRLSCGVGSARVKITGKIKLKLYEFESNILGICIDLYSTFQRSIGKGCE